MWFSMLLSGLVFSSLSAQIAPVTGLHDNTPAVHAFIHARIVTTAGNIIGKGTLVVRKGIVEAVGENVRIPPDARVWDMSGLTLYPGFIDLSSDYGLPKPATQGTGDGDFFTLPPTAERPKGSAHWSPKMRADYDASEEFQADSKMAERLRSQGFTTVLATPQIGLFRGQSALVSLADAPGSKLVVKRRVAQTITLEQTERFFGGYPNSLMGMIAFIRQSFYDADWFRRAWESFTKNPNQQRPEADNALASLADAMRGTQPVIGEASNDLNVLRLLNIAREFSLSIWIRGSGEEYRKLEPIKAARPKLIVPLNFPEPPNVETPEDALTLTLDDLQHWDAAPENPGRLEKAGVQIALTAAQLQDASKFLAQVRKAIDRGLSSDGALAALTISPAKWLGLENQLGSLETGRIANIIVTDGDIFGEKTKVREVWIDGKRYEVKVPPAAEARGTWTLSGPPELSGEATVKGDADKLNGSIRIRGKEMPFLTVTYGAGRLAWTFAGDSVGVVGTVRMSGTVTGTQMTGVGEEPDGSSFSWTAQQREGPKAEPDTSKPKKIEMASFPEVSPPGEFGFAKPPEQPAVVLVKNATIWTEGNQGRLENADMLIRSGKIESIGRNLPHSSNAILVDATGKHVTPGIIDCHSHTAASSINEGGKAVTCETRIEDVLDPDNIWIYRQLAGGTTMANVLHGSANPIGGQNAVVKWRWGTLPQEMLFKGAMPGVKFALGENVKQSNFQPGGRPTGRYPQTRMGVQQIIRDRFRAALDYEKEWQEWEKDKSKIPPRKDLELDALLEIVRGKRLIHAHSYRQDEILMLIRVCEEFGVKIATFQHVLEGYKVADVIARHGAGASTFSDWWAYKIEAWDAIPGNGPLMQRQGVVVSFNSDNSQLASRLNWEAAKATKFGLSEEEALKFVTINPAIQLKIDGSVGSLEPGKDADFVVWSGNPLSSYTKCEQTWIDGRRYFDLQQDRQLRQEVQKRRAAIIQKVITAKKELPPSGPPSEGPPRRPRRPQEEHPYSCMDEFLGLEGGAQ
jgi:imidazolonepropionase-like amidohydrolase